jgi:2-oxoglutarate ferredoxin oxidoreductase subunit alpha
MQNTKTILIGGQAGQGPNLLMQLIGNALVKKGYFVFASRDYQSLIRGGHNFNTITFSSEKVHSNESKTDILVCLDENTEKLHKQELKKSGFIIKSKEDESKENMYFAGKLFKILCLPFELLEEQLKHLKNFEENITNAKNGYKTETKSCSLSFSKKENPNATLINGTQGITEGAIASGLDIYMAYPMTPATPLLFELAPKQFNNNFLVLELENEIAVANTALGASMTGAKVMIGTSGGGFDLMTEALSMGGQAEIPLVCCLGSRPGPGTGVATYTMQGDLKLALNYGHGEFFHFLVSPGDPQEAIELTNQCFYFSQKYKLPTILLYDKHIAEALYTRDNKEDKAKIIKSEKTTELKRYNSYEHTKDTLAIATEDAETIKKNFEMRAEQVKKLSKEAEKFEMFKIHGKKDSKNIIVSYGSTKGAILDAIKQGDLNCKFIQLLYLSPFPKSIEQELKNAKTLLLVENSATGELAGLLSKKLQIQIPIKNKILRYDGRPFFQDELKEEIQRRLK